MPYDTIHACCRQELLAICRPYREWPSAGDLHRRSWRSPSNDVDITLSPEMNLWCVGNRGIAGSLTVTALATIKGVTDEQGAGARSRPTYQRSRCDRDGLERT